MHCKFRSEAPVYSVLIKVPDTWGARWSLERSTADTVCRAGVLHRPSTARESPTSIHENSMHSDCVVIPTAALPPAKKVQLCLGLGHLQLPTGCGALEF